jgi:hypothetical protein
MVMVSSGMFADVLADLNSCQHLYLREIGEADQNSLRLVIEEGVPSPQTTSVNFGGTVIAGVHKVTFGKHTRLFEVIWDSYVAYSIRNESYVVKDDTEQYALGNLARIYSRSKFLDYVAIATIAANDYPGPSQHVELICECHIIDVVSTTLPSVRKLRPEPSA